MLTVLFYCMVVALVGRPVEAAKASPSPAPSPGTPGTWSGPTYQFAGFLTEDTITTNDGVTYNKGTSTHSVSGNSSSWFSGLIDGGYDSDLGAEFYYGRAELSGSSITIEYRYYLNTGETYNSSTQYQVPVTLAVTNSVKSDAAGTLEAGTADNGLGSGSSSYNVGGYIITNSQGSKNVESISADYDSTTNSVVVIAVVYISSSASNPDQSSWVDTIQYSIQTAQPTVDH